MKKSKPKRAIFTIDDEKVYHGITFGDTWNGFECPWFDQGVADQICEDLSTDECKLYYNAARNVFVEEQGGESSEFEKKKVTINGVTMTYHSIGGWAWIWSAV